MAAAGLTATDLSGAGVRLLKRGKVRDLYALDDEHLLLVATDRLSAFDCALAPAIPDKGRILTEVSRFWFEHIGDRVANHLAGVAGEAGDELVRRFPEQLAGRSLTVRRARVVPVECVVRGFLVGAAWREYRERGTVNGMLLPRGLRACEPLPEPLFTPTTKAEKGHDVPLTPAQLARQVGEELARRLGQLSVELFLQASARAGAARLVLVDTKFEFGWLGDGSLAVVDELLTPDSSRYWPVESYRAGAGGTHWDKEYVRSFLLGTEWGRTDRTVPPPPLPDGVVEELGRRYRSLRDRLLAGSPA